MVPCSCGKQYVGETGATIKTRIKQHEKRFSKIKTAILLLLNMQIMCPGDIQWDNVSILASENQYFRRSVRKSLEIQRQRTLPGEGLNKDIGR